MKRNGHTPKFCREWWFSQRSKLRVTLDTYEGVRIFLGKVIDNWITSAPEMASDLKRRSGKLEQVAGTLRALAQDLRAEGSMHKDARKLESVADDCDDEARALFPWRPRDIPIKEVSEADIDDPGVFVRDIGEMKVKAFMVAVAVDTAAIFGTPLYGIVAAIANVVFERSDLQASSARETYRLKRL